MLLSIEGGASLELAAEKFGCVRVGLQKLVVLSSRGDNHVGPTLRF